MAILSSVSQVRSTTEQLDQTPVSFPAPAPAGLGYLIL